MPKAKTLTVHEKYAIKARERFGSMTPLRLGIVIGKDGGSLSSPYAPGSRGDELYMEGLVFGRKEREKRLAASGVTVPGHQANAQQGPMTDSPASGKPIPSEQERSPQ